MLCESRILHTLSQLTPLSDERGESKGAEIELVLLLHNLLCHLISSVELVHLHQTRVASRVAFDSAEIFVELLALSPGVASLAAAASLVEAALVFDLPTTQ